MSISILPPLWLTTPYAVARPSPVPLPVSFVVKNGSKARVRVSSSMPVPVSVISTATKGSASESTSLVEIVSTPPSGIASRPLIAMLSTTCASWSGSVSTSASAVCERRRQLDLGADRAGEHRLQVADDVVDVEPLGQQHLLAAEREQLPRQGRGVGGGLPHLVDVVRARVAFVERVARAAPRSR